MWIETGNSSAVLQPTATCISQSVSAPLPGNTSAEDSGSTSTAEPSTSSSSDESAGGEDKPQDSPKAQTGTIEVASQESQGWEANQKENVGPS